MTDKRVGVSWHVRLSGLFKSFKKILANIVVTCPEIDVISSLPPGRGAVLACWS